MAKVKEGFSAESPDTASLRWSMIASVLARPYPVTLPTVLFVSLVPLYFLIPALLPPDRTLYVPELGLDRALPFLPAWSLVYQPLYFFLIVLPVLVVRRREHVSRTVYAYLLVWITAYVFFIAYPTVAPRPTEVPGQGFGAWGLRILYSADPPYNCFPSLHVAHSFVSALTCCRLHRNLGVAAIGCASVVAVSTLFTKQHYVLDLVAGLSLAAVAYVLFLRNYSREDVPELDRRVAPVLGLGALGLTVLGVAGFWVAYRLTAG